MPRKAWSVEMVHETVLFSDNVFGDISNRAWCGPIYVLTFETCLIYKTYAHKLSTALFYFFVRLLADQHFAYIDVFAFNMT